MARFKLFSRVQEIGDPASCEPNDSTPARLPSVMLTEYLVGDAEAADQQRSRAEEEALRRSRRRRDRRACRKEEIEEREDETGRREGRGDATRGRSCEGDGRGGRAGHGRRVGEEMPLQARSAEEERGGLRESTRALV